jgi:hypothetical protein
MNNFQSHSINSKIVERIYYYLIDGLNNYKTYLTFLKWNSQYCNEFSTRCIRIKLIN